jgi:hypothetical protein
VLENVNMKMTSTIITLQTIQRAMRQGRPDLSSPVTRAEVSGALSESKAYQEELLARRDAPFELDRGIAVRK